MKKLAAVLLMGVLVAWMPVANVAHANGVMNTFTLHFDNLDLDLGLATQIDVDNQYLSMWGVRFNKVYRYIDDRDPFSDPGELPVGSLPGFQTGPYNFGISNGNIANINAPNQKGHIFFDYGATSYFEFDWWTLDEPMTVTALNAAGDVQDQFTYDGIGIPSFGTHTLYGDISQVIFHDGGGSVGIANMSYESAIPEPGTLGLVGLGLAGLAAARRRRKANS